MANHENNNVNEDDDVDDNDGPDHDDDHDDDDDDAERRIILDEIFRSLIRRCPMTIENKSGGGIESPRNCPL